MNARNPSFEFTCFGKKIKDITCALFHSILFNRCLGKFQYEFESSYSIGTLGFEEIVCDFIDFTYIQVSSSELVSMINKEITIFANALRSSATLESMGNNFSTSPRRMVLDPLPPPSFYPDYSSLPPSTSNNTTVGQINLSFLIKSSSAWSRKEPLVWEIWTVKFNCLDDNCDEDKLNQIPIEDQLFERMLSVVQIVNNCQYMPHTPNQSQMDNIFDTSFSDAQPYNFKISYKINSLGNELRSSDDQPSPQQAITRFLRNRLAL